MVNIIPAHIADTLATGARVDKKPSGFGISGVSVFVITNGAWAEIREQVNGWIHLTVMKVASITPENERKIPRFASGQGFLAALEMTHFLLFLPLSVIPSEAGPCHPERSGFLSSRAKRVPVIPSEARDLSPLQRVLS